MYFQPHVLAAIDTQPEGKTEVGVIVHANMDITFYTRDSFDSWEKRGETGIQQLLDPAFLFGIKKIREVVLLRVPVSPTPKTKN